MDVNFFILYTFYTNIIFDIQTLSICLKIGNTRHLLALPSQTLTFRREKHLGISIFLQPYLFRVFRSRRNIVCPSLLNPYLTLAQRLRYKCMTIGEGNELCIYRRRCSSICYMHVATSGCEGHSVLCNFGGLHVDVLQLCSLDTKCSLVVIGACQAAFRHAEIE